MNPAHIAIATASVFGLVLFSAFLIDVWNDKKDRKDKGDFHY